jgi:uncharacterized protein (TIGR02145 family)
MDDGAGGTIFFAAHNLGADTSYNPDIPRQEIAGDYYQWGNITPVATAYTSDGAIAGWNSTGSSGSVWADSSKSASDPCPDGFRVPTKDQMTALTLNNDLSAIGSFDGSSTNFGAAHVITNGANKLTLPASGRRFYAGGPESNRAETTGYWTSTYIGPCGKASTNCAWNLYLEMNVWSVSSNEFIPNGFAVRCVLE